MGMAKPACTSSQTFHSQIYLTLGFIIVNLILLVKQTSKIILTDRRVGKDRHELLRTLRLVLSEQRYRSSKQVAADAMGCTKATISAFAKNGTTPKGDTVARAAQMLDVSADYLLGLIDEPHGVVVNKELTSVEEQVVTLIRELNTEGADAALAMLTGLASQDIYKKSSTISANKKEA